MVIDWSVTAVYNTIMSVATGVGLLLIVKFLKDLRARKIGQLEGWAVGFGLLGFILITTGLHMTLTWPLSKMGFAFDDIIFGESSLAFGVILLAVAILLWRKSNLFLKQGVDTSSTKDVSDILSSDLPILLKPISYFGAAMGFALISMAIAGVTYQLFAAPPEEPISGAFAEYPMVEAIFISGLLTITGLGAILFAFIQKQNPNEGLVKTVNWLWIIAGIIFTGFGIMNYFTHIGLIVNTMG